MELTIKLEQASGVPLYEQIYEYIKSEICKGNLESGSRLPSSRMLAQYLQVSRSTVGMAYDQLISEGYVEAVPCKGCFVADVSDIEDMYGMTLGMHVDVERVQPEGEKYEYDFSPRGVDLNCFPFNNWRKVTRSILNEDNRELFQLGNPQGEYAFRVTIHKYLHQSRGVNCSPDNIIIGAGNEYLLMLLNQILGGNNVFAMENPTYKQVYRIFTSLAQKVVMVDLDKHGMNVDELEKTGANIAYVMPSHQYPLGVVMPLKRRVEMLKWAKSKENRYIIEDDYDSEFRYRGKPIPSLQGYDADGKVIYIGTFSKSIAPAIRMSYMVLPDALLEIYRKNLRFYSSTVSRIDQNIVNEFIRRGCYERHLNKMRNVYKARHDTLLAALKTLGEDFVISGENAGLHILLQGKHMTENEMIQAAQRAGVKVYPLSEYYIEDKKDKKDTILLGYSKMDETKIIEGIERLKKAFC